VTNPELFAIILKHALKFVLVNNADLSVVAMINSLKSMSPLLSISIISNISSTYLIASSGESN